MAEIEFLLPTVQYGNVKIRATPEELGLEQIDGGNLGYAYAVFLNLFTQGFQAGSQADVEWQGGGATPPPPEPIQRAAEALITETLGATKVSEEEGLGGVTELPVGDDFAKTEEQIKAETGKAPWESRVDAKAKPWETSGKAPEAPAAVASIDWS